MNVIKASRTACRLTGRLAGRPAGQPAGRLAVRLSPGNSSYATHREDACPLKCHFHACDTVPFSWPLWLTLGLVLDGHLMSGRRPCMAAGGRLGPCRRRCKGGPRCGSDQGREAAWWLADEGRSAGDRWLSGGKAKQRRVPHGPGGGRPAARRHDAAVGYCSSWTVASMTRASAQSSGKRFFLASSSS